MKVFLLCLDQHVAMHIANKFELNSCREFPIGTVVSLCLISGALFSDYHRRLGKHEERH